MSKFEEKEPDLPKDSRLAEIFAKMKIKGLPAMSGHVQELISLTQSSRSAGYELSQVILKDYSLTNKVLQVVNSAYYSLGRPVNSISRAVTILGFDAVRELAMAIALFEDFVKSGTEKDLISKILTTSFLSAMQARDLAVEKNLNVMPEEAFICALLRDLGKIIVCIYLPERYRKIEALVEQGRDEDEAAKEVLDDVTLPQVGKEVGAFWNLSENVIAAMTSRPPEPKNKNDKTAYLANLAAFTNALTSHVSRGQRIDKLIRRHGEMLQVGPEESLDLLGRSVDASEDISSAIRYGLSKLQIRNSLRRTVAELHRPKKDAKGKDLLEFGEPEAAAAGGGGPAQDDESPAGEELEQEEREQAKQKEIEVLDDAQASPNKSVNDFIHEITETLMGPININEFYVNLLEGMYRGIGFDRVLLAILTIQGGRYLLRGRFGFGELDREGIHGFEYDLAWPGVIPQAIKKCKDMAIPPDSPAAFPEQLQHLVAGRTVYLLPICLDNKPIGLIYLDRKKGRPRLDPGRVKTTRLFRDFAVMAIRKLRGEQK